MGVEALKQAKLSQLKNLEEKTVKDRRMEVDCCP